MYRLIERIKKPTNSAFKQQRLKAWQPLLTPFPVIVAFFSIGAIFISLGVVFLLQSNSIGEVSIRYDLACEGKEVCTFDLHKDTHLKAPVYIYYQLVNFYQNHRRYVRSRNDDQLRHVAVTSTLSLVDCAPFSSFEGSSDPNMFYLPCGLIARTVFNDTFVVMRDQEAVVLRKQGIAWPSDLNYKFKNPSPNTVGIRVVSDFEDEDLIVWMRTAGLPSFRKLWRISDHDIIGEHTIVMHNNFPVSSFSGEKYLVMSEIGWLGGRNSFLGIAYLTVGAIYVFFGILFLIKHCFGGRQLGDMSYLM